ncbi:MAG TPA: PKD domain-containing protein, partial [Paenirhodobacter sp.]
VAVQSDNVTITDNITSLVGGYTGQSGWTVAGNVIVQDQDPLAAGYYGDVFVTSSLDSEDGAAHHFIVLPDGTAGTSGAGAATNYQPASEALSPEFQVSEANDNVAQRDFDASYSTLNGQSLNDGVTYIWDFGDGSSGIGAEISHSYSQGGTYEVTLTAILADGTSASETVSVSVAGSELMHMGDDAIFYSTSYGNGTALSATGSKTVTLADATYGLDLGGTGTALSLSSSGLIALRGSDEASFSMTLTADTIGSSGEIFRINNAIVATVNAAGDVFVWFYTTEGKTLLYARGADVNDGATHDVSIDFGDGVLSISVDGTVLGTTAVSGTITTSTLNSLVFGNVWGQPNFDATLSDFSVTAHDNQYASAAADNAAHGSDLELSTGDTTGKSAEDSMDTAPLPSAVTDDNNQSGADIPTAGHVAGDIEAAAPADNAPLTGVSPIPDSAPNLATDILVSFLNGTFYSHEYGADSVLSSGYLDDDSQSGLDLGGAGTAATVSWHQYEDLQGSDSLGVSLTLTADTIGSSGEIFRINNVLTASVNDAGELYVWLNTDTEKALLYGTGYNIADGALHDISINFSDGALSITIDDNLAGTKEVTGSLTSNPLNNLLFGNAWGQENFDATLTDFSIGTGTITSHSDDLLTLSDAGAVAAIYSGTDYVSELYTIDYNILADADTGAMYINDSGLL